MNKIDKDVPLPKARGNGITSVIRELDVGDSTVIPLKGRTNLPQIAINLEIKLTTRKISDSEVRVWRIE